MYKPKVSGNRKRLLAWIFLSLIQTNDRLIRKPKMKSDDTSIRRNEKRTIQTMLNKQDIQNKSDISSRAA